jgi:ribosome maturation factor RimP
MPVVLADEPPLASQLDIDGSADEMTARTPQRQQLIDLLEPVITAQDHDLEDLTVTAAGRRSLIRVVVDADGGIDLDAVAGIARAIFAGPYVLEVTSPGVDRPLTQARQWRRAVGRLVSVEVAGQLLTGRVVSADEGSVTFDVAGIQQTHPLAALGSGRVQVEFSRPGTADEADDADEIDADETDADETDADEIDEPEISSSHDDHEEV